MELLTGLRSELLSKRCEDCRNLCSVGPVWNVSDDGTKFICGRCAVHTRPFKARNLAFEKMAKHFSFPCIYKGCDEEIAWGEEACQHEIVCPHRTMRCPLSSDCKRTVPVRDLELHLYHFHLYQLTRSAIPVDLTKGGYRVALVEFDTKLFIVLIGTVYWPEVRVSSLEDLSGVYKFNVCLYKPGGSPVCLRGTEEGIDQFDDRNHCLDCLSNCCEQVHRYKNRGNFVSISMRTIRAVFGDALDSLAIRVEISRKDMDDDKPLQEAEKVAGGMRLKESALAKMISLDVLKRKLVCHECKRYMTTGNIHNCKFGKVLCDNCRFTDPKGRLRDSRNFPLERLAEAVFHGCR